MTLIPSESLLLTSQEVGGLSMPYIEALGDEALFGIIGVFVGAVVIILAIVYFFPDNAVPQANRNMVSFPRSSIIDNFSYSQSSKI